MEDQLNLETNVSYPKDKSLEAYMDWIMRQRLSRDNTETKFTEAEWAAAWKEYWEEGSNYLL